MRLAALAASVTSMAFCASATAQSPAATTAPNTITVTGTGEVKPKPADPKSNDSIAKAVEEAAAAATPLAIADGRVRATTLAQLAGLTLGPLLAIAETTNSPFGYFGPFGQQGTFGPGRFCGTIRSSRLVKTKSGKRKRVVRTRQGCRVPREIYASLTMTFASTAA